MPELAVAIVAVHWALLAVLATGRPGSSCQATTWTLAMRRPSFTTSARARLSAGPADRR
jgi:hypothetical protein